MDQIDTRRLERIALPTKVAQDLDGLLELYREVATMERILLRMQGKAPAILSKENWLSQTDEGRAAYAKAGRMAAKLGYDASQEFLADEYRTWLQRNNVYAPTHGAARTMPPPTYLLGDLVARAMEMAGPALERWVKARHTELGHATRKQAKTAA